MKLTTKSPLFNTLLSVALVCATLPPLNFLTSGQFLFGGDDAGSSALDFVSGAFGLFALVPLLIALFQSNAKVALQSGGLFGLLIGTFMYWGVYSYSASVFVLVLLVFSLVFAVTGYLLKAALHLPNAIAAMSAGFVWALHEWTLQAAGLPYSYLVLTNQAPELMQPLRWVGQYLMSGLLISFQAAVVLLIVRSTSRPIAHGVYLVATAIIIIACWVGSLTQNKESIGNEFINVSVVQTSSHPSRHIFKAADNVLEQSIATRKRFASMIANDRDLVIWPESSVLGYEFRHSKRHVPYKHSTHLISSPDLDPEGFRYSRVFSIDSHATVINSSGKQRLIPLIEGSYSQDGQSAIHHHAPGSPTVLVCYESAFTQSVHRAKTNALTNNDSTRLDPNTGNLKLRNALDRAERKKIETASSGENADASVKNREAGTHLSMSASNLAEWRSKLIVITTSDAFAGPSILPELHQRFGAIRAIEHNRYVLRSANGGISSVIDNTGQVRQSLELFQSGIINDTVQLISSQSFYAQNQRGWSLFMWVMSLLTVLISLRPSFLPEIIGSSQSRAQVNPVTTISALSRTKLSVLITLLVMVLIVAQVIWASHQYNKTTGALNTPKITANNTVQNSAQAPTKLSSSMQGTNGDANTTNNRWKLHSPFFKSTFSVSDFSYRQSLVDAQQNSIWGAITFVLRTYGEPISAAQLIKTYTQQTRPSIAEPNLYEGATQLLRELGYGWRAIDLNTDTFTLPIMVMSQNGEFLVVEKIENGEIEAFSAINGPITLPSDFLAFGVASPAAYFITTMKQPWDTNLEAQARLSNPGESITHASSPSNELSSATANSGNAL